MPIVELHVLKGYSSEEKQRLGQALTDAVRFVVPAAAELVTVIIHEMSPENYYRGGSQRVGAPAKADPARLVVDYLQALEARDLEKARAMLSEDFTMTFPGTEPMHRLEDLIEWSRPRYKFVAKTYEGLDAMQGDGDASIVYCRGTLSGEFHDGKAFDGIRFIDRFEITANKISTQSVWNDMAEVRAQK